MPRTVMIVLLALGNTSPGRAQSRPSFEVAAIKRNISEARGQRGPSSSSPGTFIVENAPLRGLILGAYGVRANQLVGGPELVASDRYDITAKARVAVVEGAKIEPRKSMEEAWVMPQSLLEDRFKLKVHWKTRELPVYVLTVAKGGLKMEHSNCVLDDPNNPPLPGGNGSCTGFRGVQPSGLNRTLDATGITMSDWILPLENSTRREWIDKTELTGRFNIHLTWTVDGAFAATPADPTGQDERVRGAASLDAGSPSLYTALQDQLGLKLESTKAPAKILVIDHIKKLDEN